MKILVFSPFYPPHVGGVEFFARDLHKNLREAGIEITVFTPLLPNTAEPFEKAVEADIIRFPAWEIIHNYPLPKYWPFFWTFGFWRSFRSLWKERPDIVISHTRFFNTSLLALAYAKIRNIPLLHIEHGSSFVQSGNTFVQAIAKIYDLTIGTFILRHADRVVAISEKVKSFIQNLCGRNDIVIIRRGFDLETIESIAPTTSLPKPDSVIRIVFIGRLISGKGVHILIKALKQLNTSAWECLIIGDGPERRKLEAQTSSIEKRNVFFLGEKTWEETIALLKTADIFVNPSLTEGLPTTVAEAALCGKAIIATDVGGTREFFSQESNPFLIPANDPISLSEKLSELITNTPLRKYIGDMERRHVSEKFSWNQTTERFLATFKDLTI